MKRLLTTLVILTGLICSAGAVWADARSDLDKGFKADKAGNYAIAAKWYRKAAEQGDADAQFNLGVMYRKGEGVVQDYAEAVKWYRKAAEQGYAQAQNSLGVLYDKGWGVTQDYAEAAKWYRKAAKQGDATAQNNLGVLYDNGWGVTQDMVAAKGFRAAQSGDFATAMKWLRKAAEQGHAGAQFWVGTLYKGGNGVTQDYAEAVKWFRKAAEQGDTQGQNNIGQMYRKGKGVTQDYQEARKWFRKAAEKGDSTGQNNLGVLYDNGWGVTRDTVAAFMWFDIAVANRGESHRVRRDSGNFWGIAARKLSSADIVEAQKRAKRCMASDYKDCDIGSAGAVRADAQSDAVKGLKAYQAGDYAEAMKWLRKAAEQGHAGAQVNLGVMYAKGEGVLQDTIAAHMWFNIAAANGEKRAVKNRDIAAGKLSSADIVKAQQMAKRCMASGYKDCD